MAIPRRPRWPRAVEACSSCGQEAQVPVAPWLGRRIRDLARHQIVWIGHCRHCRGDVPITVGAVLRAVNVLAVAQAQ